MGDKGGIVHFPGNLDPRAREFRPRYQPNHNHLNFAQPQIYHPYLPYPPYASSELQVMPFYEVSVGYPQFAAPLAYVRTFGADPPLPPPLPPPSPKPSRTLLLSLVPADMSESNVRRELEVFGDVRAVQMERVRDGIVTVHFYDLRHAQAAMVEIQDQHMQQQYRLRKHFDGLSRNTHNSLYGSKSLVPRAPLPPPARGLIAGRAVWAQFMIPATAGLPDGHNQGTLVIFNLDSEVSTSSLEEIFEAFGPVKELRETPLKRHQKFVEFFDVRDAAKALAEMNGKEIHGKHVVIEYSRPGGYSRRFSKGPQNATVFGKLNSNNNWSTRTSRCLPPPLSLPPLSHKISRRSQPTVPPGCYKSQIQLSTKKSGFGKGNPSGKDGNKSTHAGAVEASMASLCVSGGSENSIEESNNKPPRKSTKKTHSAITTKEQQHQQQQQLAKNIKQWTGSRQSKDESRFLINEEAILESNCVDPRTTVMIRNIPNKYSQKLLLNMLDNHCINCNEQIADGEDDEPLSSYDFVYLPIDFMNKCNVGYGFVNMTTPQATWRFYKAFHHQNWEVFNSRKICEVTYARLQGVEALKEHFNNSKFLCESEEYMPVVFSPPRDGRRLTEPIPIIGRTIYPEPLFRCLHAGTSNGWNPTEPEKLEEDDENKNGYLYDYEGDDVDVGGGKSSSRNGGDSVVDDDQANK